jgi:hypothetical protein
MIGLRASWEVVGIVVERRELTSEKSKSWKGYVCKVSTLGMTAEIALTDKLFPQVGEGQHLVFRGRFEERGGYLKLIAESVAAYTIKAGAA